MKKTFALILSISMATAFIFSSCNKDDDNTPAKTKTELITSASWKFSSATVGGTDVSAFLQACQKDNKVTLVAAGTGTLDEGTTKCNAGDPQITNITWNFQSSETQVFVSYPLFTGGSSTFTLVSLTESTMVLSQPMTVGASTQTAIVTFIH
jgi:hypothetical protein